MLDKQRKDGRYPQCKLCQKFKIERWASKNKSHITQYHKDYYQSNKSKVKEYQQQNKIRRAKYMKMWRNKNKSRLKEYKRNYHNLVESKDINSKLLHNLRSRLQQSIKQNKKWARTMELVGCSVNDLKKHLESKFVNGMSWDNYGRTGWHIDHILPCYSFDLSKEDEQRKCFHYTNLQPLWAVENCRKNKYIYLLPSKQFSGSILAELGVPSPVNPT
jgi:hypothetical protein